MMSHLCKSNWTETEDNQLVHLYYSLKEKDDVKSIWNEIAKYFPDRSSEQCRKRWRYKFNFSANQNLWSHDEDMLLMHLHEKFESNWSIISKFLNKRSDIEAKNRFTYLERSSFEQQRNSNQDICKVNPSGEFVNYDDSNHNCKKTRTLEQDEKRLRNYFTFLDNVNSRESTSKEKETIEKLDFSFPVLTADCLDFHSIEDSNKLPSEFDISESSITSSFKSSNERYVSACNESKSPRNIWSEAEDRRLTYYYNLFRDRNTASLWKKIAEHLPGRSNEQCRKRWRYKLNPNINLDEWTPEDDIMLLNLYTAIGNKWVRIGNMLNRSDVEIKNRFLLLQRQEKKLDKLLTESFLTSDQSQQPVSSLVFEPITKTTHVTSPQLYNHNARSFRPSPLSIPHIAPNISPLVILEDITTEI